MLFRRTLLKSLLTASAVGLFAPVSSMARAAASLSGNPQDPELLRFIAELPKAELHLHIEGTLEAEMKFALAERNGIKLPYANVDEVRQSYGRIRDLQSFLAVYYEGMDVLLKEQDFYDLCFAFLRKAASQNLLYVEIFFDPQAHTRRGVPIAAVFAGLTRAQTDARQQFGIDSQLIMCFLRELSAASAMETLEAALPYKQHLVGVGLDSDEKGNPPNKFTQVFRRAREEGLKVTLHCDLNQDNTHEHIRQAVEDLAVDRIDHGGNVIDKPELIEMVKARGLYLTVCPGSSGTSRYSAEPVDVLREMLNLGLKATINTDDPAYMGGNYLNEVFANAQQKSQLSKAEMVQLSRNAFNAAWISDSQRAGYLQQLDAFARRWQL